MRDTSRAHVDAIVLRSVLAGLALETKLIRLQRQLHAKAGRRSRAHQQDSQTAASGCPLPGAANGPHSTRIGPAAPLLKIRPRSRKPQRWRMGRTSCRSEYTLGESPSTNNTRLSRRTARAGSSRHPGKRRRSGMVRPATCCRAVPSLRQTSSPNQSYSPPSCRLFR
jgi:hypothetical protein